MNDKPVLPKNEQIQFMKDTFPGMIWFSGADKKYYTFNKNWLDFRGRAEQQEVEGLFTNDIHPDDLEEYKRVYNASFDNRQPFQIKYRLKRHDGEYRWVLTNATPQFDDQGLLTGYVASTLDIHDLAQEMILRDEFISSASHELKIPVTTIKVYAQLLEDFFDRGGDEKHLDFLKKVNKQVVKLTRLINNLVESNKIYDSGIELNQSDFDFNKLIIEEISRVQSEAQKHNIVVTGYIPQNVYGDREKLAQAFNNLLDNAIKFSPDADTVEVSLENNNETVSVTVRDYGIGIKADEKEKIFKRFYRVHDNTANTFPGVGLGLYISSQIIKQHGGEITLENGSSGCNFKITIPYDNRT